MHSLTHGPLGNSNLPLRPRLKGSLQRAGLVLVLAGGLLAACRGQGDGSLSRVRATAELRIAMSADYPPFSYTNHRGALEGFDVDVSRQVADRLGVGLRIVATPWEGMMEGLLKGAYDAILGSMAITPERARIVAFSSPYYHTAVQVLVHKEPALEGIQDLKAARIGVGAGSGYEKDARRLGAGAIRMFASGTQALLALHNKEIEAVIIDQIAAANAIELGLYDIRYLGSPLRTEEVGVAFRREDLALREAVNEILDDMRRDGTLKRLIKKVANCEYHCKAHF